MKKRIEVPKTVSIETTNRCNASCSFCPNNSLARNRLTMSDELFKKIISDCMEFNPEYIEPFLNGEPLMDSKIFERITYIRENLPETKIKLYTNGNLLTPEKTDLLAQIGIEELFVSINSLNCSKYMEVMGLDLKKTLSNMEYLINKRDFVANKIVFRMTRTNDTSLFEQDQFIRYCDELGVKSYIVGLFNYKGSIESDLPIPNYPCEHIERVDILSNGNVTLCCMDQEGEYSWGNVKNSSILEIFNGKKASLYKNLHREGKRNHIAPCYSCNLFWPTLRNVSPGMKMKFGFEICKYFLNNQPSGRKTIVAQTK